jgi:hypothetical protein
MFGPCMLTNVLWQAEKTMLHSVDLTALTHPQIASAVYTLFHQPLQL